MARKIVYVMFGFAMGFVFSLFVPELGAQYGDTWGGSSKSFDEKIGTTPIPAKYGDLVGIQGTLLYFQGKDGTVYLMRQRSDSEMEKRVVVIPRQE
jgi:hypothetical protein